MRLPRRSELSPQQEDFLMEAPFNEPVLCVGPPGTGKTVLALYRAAALYEQGRTPDFVMHSKLLNRYVERSVIELDMHVHTRTWHSWVYSKWSGGVGRKMPESQPWSPDFMRAIEFLSEYGCTFPGKLSWTHLIVDEGQDFPKEFYIYLTWLMSAELITKAGKRASVTVFADDNQRMEEGRNSTVNEIMTFLGLTERFEVTTNYRNTAQIARLASYFYAGMSTGMPDIPENINGPVPRLVRCQSLREEMLSVVRWLHNNDDLSAGVIVPNRRVQKRAVESLKIEADKRGLRVQMYATGVDPSGIDFYGKGVITVVCDKSCKGLEFDGVFIPQLQNYRIEGADQDFFRMKMYVMLSRARSFLQLSYAECEDDPAILRFFPPSEQGILIWPS